MLRGHVSEVHVHLFVSVSPPVSISKLVQDLKGKSSLYNIGSKSGGKVWNGSILTIIN